MHGYANPKAGGADDLEDDSFLLQRTIALRKNPMYKYLDLQGGGKLINHLRHKGVEFVTNVLRDEIPEFLYQSGKGERVLVTNILKLSLTKYLDLSTSAKSADKICLAPDVEVRRQMVQIVLSKYESQTEYACWELGRRGILGESLLHVCLMHQSKEHLTIAKILLKLFPNLAKDFFIGSHYFGQSALHMAVVNGHVSLARLLIKFGADLSRRAMGTFFLPEFGVWLSLPGKTPMNPLNMRREDFRYYGEYPLAFAACVGHQELYDLIVESGGNPNAQDTFGNTVLHVVVINNRNEMYRLALRHYRCPAEPSVLNRDGLTPVALAAKLGRQNVFNEIINLNTIGLWKFSNISCAVYPLTGLDSIGPDGNTDWNSALMHVVNGKSTEHLAMLEGGVISQLLEEKWKAYARSRFVERLCLGIGQMFILSIAIYLREDSVGEIKGVVEKIGNDERKKQIIFQCKIVRYIMESITVLGAIINLCIQFGEIKEQGMLDFLKGLRNYQTKSSVLLASLCIFICLPVRITKTQMTDPLTICTLRTVEESLLIVAVPLYWLGLLFYTGGARLTGPFVTVINKIMRGDLIRFGIIYVVILWVFAQAYYYLFKDVGLQSISSFRSIGETFMTLILLTLGEFKVSKGESMLKYDEFNYVRNVLLTKLVFVIFMTLMPILLLNLLIAMMGSTYHQVITMSEREWTNTWANIVINMERTYSRKKLLKFLEGYAIPFPRRPDKERGLVVICRQIKTLAYQRNTAVANWKRAYQLIHQLIQSFKRNLLATAYGLNETPGAVVTGGSKVPLKIPSDTSLLEGTEINRNAGDNDTIQWPDIEDIIPREMLEPLEVTVGGRIIEDLN